MQGERQGRRLVADRPELHRRTATRSAVLPAPPVGRRRRRLRRDWRAAARNLGPSNPDAARRPSRERVAAYRELNGLAADAHGAGRRGDRVGIGPRPRHLGRQRPAAGRRGSPRPAACRSTEVLDARRRAHRRPPAGLPRRGRERARAQPRPRPAASRSRLRPHGPRRACAIYLGAAPGVGKTFAMLDEGWRRHERGTDVVVGFVETHGRPKTAGAAPRPRGRAPPARSTYRGADVRGDGRRRRPRPPARRSRWSTSWPTPTCPARRNAKRWQDVEELLDAGIDVISTVNIQHLESLNDVVERITGVTQRETVPDEVVRARRPDRAGRHDARGAAPAHGPRQHLHAPRRSTPRSANYFRVGNLARAARAGAAVGGRPGRRGAPGVPRAPRHRRPWETRERVVVALTGAPGGEDLVRRAARMASAAREASSSACTWPPATASPAPPASALEAGTAPARGARRSLPRGRRRRRGARRWCRSPARRERHPGRARRQPPVALARAGAGLGDQPRDARSGGGSIDVHVISTTNRNDGESPPATPRRKARLAAVPAAASW